MRSVLMILICFLICNLRLHAQLLNKVKGFIVNANTNLPILNAQITISNTSIFQRSNKEGFFIITNLPLGDQTLTITLDDYETQRFSITIAPNESIDLGTILLVFDFPSFEENSGLISLTEDDLNNDDNQAENTAGLLQSSKDVFQKRAAFDFSQAFFRVRGYDSKNAQILMNGISMNKQFNGRPQWNNWGGLNDMTRNQELSTALTPSNYSFGDVLGVINISTRASRYRPGIRISSSFSNRTYVGRAMATYSSGLQKNGISYAFSASRRWGNEGFVEGTLYDSFGFFGALEYRFSDKNSMNLTAIYAPNKRGGTAAITERVFNELGRKYNPNWGLQGGNKRSARIRAVEEPIFMFSHFYESEKMTLTTSIAYQFGKQGRSRLDYANAPNPNPNYWRYLPNISEKPQIDWNNMYAANTNTTNIADAGAARYILYEDRADDHIVSATSILNTKVTEHLSLDIGGSYKRLTSENFGNPIDLLGATHYTDVNQFTLIDGKPAQNDALGNINKGINDKIKYHYSIFSSQINGFSQVQYNSNKFDFFLSGSYTTTNYQREGKFLNESFEDNSLGKSEELIFNDFGFKGGITYKFSGRHLLLINGAYLSKAPTIRNSFINSRENNNIVSGLESEKITSVEATYIFRSSQLKTRFTSYFTEFTEGTDINFVFAQSGSGTDFFQEVVSNIDKRHFGAELGIEYQASLTTKIFLVGAYGNHTYIDNAIVSINFDTAGFNDDVINDIGFKDLGETNIKGIRVANGPQQAYAVGIEYRDPKYWWISATANYLSHSYVDVSTITRTSDFFVNSDDPLGLPFEDVDKDLAKELLQQEAFDGYYLLNITGGKSWRIKSNYLSFFVSINNAFDAIYRTGGYEQSRTANYADLVEDTANGNSQRNFGNKYWYGFGRSYFINLAYNF